MTSWSHHGSHWIAGKKSIGNYRFNHQKLGGSSQANKLLGPATRDMVPKPLLFLAVQFVAKQGTESLHAACSKTNSSEETLYFKYVQIHSHTFSYSRAFKNEILEINHVDTTPAPLMPKLQECQRLGPLEPKAKRGIGAWQDGCRCCATSMFTFSGVECVDCHNEA